MPSGVLLDFRDGFYVQRCIPVEHGSSWESVGATGAACSAGLPHGLPGASIDEATALITSAAMGGQPAKSVLLAAIGALGLLLVPGCQSTPAKPACSTTAPSDDPVGAGGVSVAWCQAAQDNYEAAQRRSFPEKLRDGDRDSWLKVGIGTFVVSAIGIGLQQSTRSRSMNSGTAALSPRPTQAEPLPPQSHPLAPGMSGHFESEETEWVYEAETVNVADSSQLDEAIDTLVARRQAQGFGLHEIHRSFNGQSANAVFVKKVIRHRQWRQEHSGDA